MELSQLKKISKANLVEKISNLIDSSSAVKNIPVQFDDIVRIGDYEIHPFPEGYFVVDTVSDNVKLITYARSAALAYAYTQVNRRTEFTKKIKELDQVIEKNEIDTQFYRNSLEGNSTTCHESLRTRLEIAVADVVAARNELHSIILSR